MFPLKDSVPSSTFPFVNWAIIFINIVVFYNMLHMTSPNEQEFIFEYGLVPKKLFVENSMLTLTDRYVPILTSMFMHGGFMHIIGNMYFLFIFGDNVEDKLGHIRYLLIYLLFGVAAAATQIIMFPDSVVPMVGASGAIAGVMGAYLVFYPRAKVKTLIVIIIFITIAEIPAFIFLLIWFLFQFLNGTGGGAYSNVAWWAHIGGFLAGLGYAIYFLKKQKEL
ncbi:Rhomboid family protein [Denitrovibrio acetiphilus DSM 12809]|uniref:Rhomboid family protein n=1 Tax=Denitrovibrio acetiphilus (strain DSM 12809 / NBRC 114555 / N2460) TaxID=522772 RepID=D4H3D8_DENA2|nr:rhomboid family intramembrane serine protease [Denitrovibrio acetiphilus]ADD67222.1 Rhomboid family protein [Denitrovibrio acetiphilus DSM 12809]